MRNEGNALFRTAAGHWLEGFRVDRLLVDELILLGSSVLNPIVPMRWPCRQGNHWMDAASEHSSPRVLAEISPFAQPSSRHPVLITERGTPLGDSKALTDRKKGQLT